MGSTSRTRSYLNEILLFLFSTGDSLFDGFCFSQDSLSFVQFVAALSIRHFLIDSRRQSMGKVRRRWGEGWGFPRRKTATTVLPSLKKSPLCPAYGTRHRGGLLNGKCPIVWAGRGNPTLEVKHPLSVSSYMKPSLTTSLGPLGRARCSHNMAQRRDTALTTLWCK